MSPTARHAMCYAMYNALRRATQRYTSLLTSSVLVTVALLAGLAPAFLFAPAASAHGATGSAKGDSSAAVHAVRLASLAVVRIVVVEAGHVICAGCYQGHDIVFPLDGGAYYTIWSGSGALISPDGYILTADHVADGIPGADAQYFVSLAINELAQKAGISVDEARQAFEQDADRIQVPTEVVKRTAFLSTAYIGPVRDVAEVRDSQTALPITRVVASSPVDKQDVAIVKVEGHDLPNVRLAPSSSVQVEDSVTAIAFPADADVGSGVDDQPDFGLLLDPQPGNEAQLDNLLTPTVESGQIIARKHLADGTLVYQTNAIGNHGSSGGAVINDRGEIVGFVDRGPLDGSTRVASLVTNEVIASYAQQAGVTNSGQGGFMTRWTAALAALDASDTCRAGQARDGLRALRADYPRFGAIQPFVREAETKAATAHCGPSVGMAAGVGGLLLLLAGAAAAVLFFLHRQGKVRLGLPARQPVGAPGTVSGTMPAMSPAFAAPAVGGLDPAYAAYNAPYALPAFPPTSHLTSVPPYAAPQAPWGAGPAATPYPAGLGAAPIPPVAPRTPVRLPVITRDLGAPVTQPPRWDVDATEIRHCTSGHTVADAEARFCTECGARVFF
jgi:S1-C subfamily serine protease